MTSTAADAADAVAELSFPRRLARTQRFTLGSPRAFTLAPDGSHAVFIRSRSGSERTGLLWVIDAATGEERLLVDPATLLADAANEDLSPEERARRERLREGGSGITAYAADRALQTVTFALSSRLFVTDAATGATRELASAGAVIDPRVSPDGSRVAYVAAGALHVATIDGSASTTLATPDAEQVTWGLAEFVASEELSRHRGHWWLADGSGLLVARVDNSPVQTWYVADPAHPETQPYPHRYPAAGTPNAEVTLWRVSLDGSRTEITWDRATFEYLVTLAVEAEHRPLIQVMDRRQQHQQVHAIEDDGSLTLLRELTNPDWLDVVGGVPAWWGERLMTVEISDDTYRLCLDGEPITPPGLQVRAVGDGDDDGVLVTASMDGVEQRLVLVKPTGATQDLGPADALVSGLRCGPTTLLRVETLQTTAPEITISRDDATHRVRSFAEDPGRAVRARLVQGPYDDSRTLVVLPTGWTPGDGPRPVIVSPYGGPHHAEVVHSGRPYLIHQWIADQGFAVVIADGRGTPGSPGWERAMRLDVAGPAVEGQVRGLEAAAKAFPEALDLSRVGIRGWSFGGYLAALAVMTRPDVFHAAVAGAPPSDWTLYDTAYTERYLGLPDEQPEAYAATSLLPLAPRLERPLLIIHGMVDDNVVVANTLRLSQALLEAGKPHQVLPLSGVTHMTPQEVVTENILRLELDFLTRSLG